MKKKVMFVVPSLRGGGAQKVMVTLLKYLDRNKFKPVLVLLTTEGKYLHEVPKDVPVVNLGTYRVRHSFFALLRVIRKEKPDVIMSTQGHLNLVMIALKLFIGRKTKLIVREANTVSEEIKSSSHQWLSKFLYKVLYKKADLIICQSRFMLNDLATNFQIPKEKMAQIYNPVDIKRIDYLAGQGNNPFSGYEESLNIVAMGRLSHQKGFGRLIESVPSLLELKPDTTLWIIGEGELKNELQCQRDQLGLSSKIKFIDFQENPYRWLKYADLFVLTSYFEGLPNVLLEAIACECPVVSLKHPGGTAEILQITRQDNRYIEKLVWEAAWFSRPRDNERELLAKVFNVETIVRKYEGYF